MSNLSYSAETQIADRTTAARQGIPVTLDAIKKAAESAQRSLPSGEAASGCPVTGAAVMTLPRPFDRLLAWRA
jgi:hypothetical protein